MRGDHYADKAGIRIDATRPSVGVDRIGFVAVSASMSINGNSRQNLGTLDVGVVGVFERPIHQTNMARTCRHVAV
jgi:hypothetical protein